MQRSGSQVVREQFVPPSIARTNFPSYLEEVTHVERNRKAVAKEVRLYLRNS